MITSFDTFTKYEKLMLEATKMDADYAELDEYFAHVRDSINRARAFILGKYPFFGEFIFSFEYIYLKESKYCETACTDGKNFYFNVLWMGKMEDKQIVFILCHEIMHNVLSHFLRGPAHHVDLNDELQRFLSNCAADYELNWMLMEEGLGTLEEIKNDWNGCIDEKYKDMPYEEIFDDLMKNIPPDVKKKYEDMKKTPKIPFPVYVGDAVKIKNGSYGKITRIKMNKSTKEEEYEIEEITKEEARELVNNKYGNSIY